MCPLRFILLFFSALLAGYFAWRTLRSSPVTGTLSEDTIVDRKSSEQNEQAGFLKTAQNGFWVFVDMASGRYLWRNVREANKSRS